MLDKGKINASIKLLLAGLVVVILSACGSSGSSSQGIVDSSAPQFSEVQVDIIHYHPSFWQKWSSSPERGVQITFEFQVTDPDGLSDIAEVYVLNLQTDDYYEIYGGPNNVPLESHYNSLSNSFSARFYTWLGPEGGSIKEFVTLTDWVVIAVDAEGNITEQEFEFTLPDHALALEEHYVYSDLYTSPDYFGIPALEAMSISDNRLSLENQIDTQSFNIQFRTKDYRAMEYVIEFYGTAPDYPYLGTVSTKSPSLVSTPIVTGMLTNVDLPYSEIGFIDGAQSSDVGGIHIVLLNEPVDHAFNENLIWYSYMSFSEFVPL